MNSSIKFITNRYPFLPLIILLSLFKLFIHLYTNAFAGYGYFRDELYYLACAARLAFGYVDQPPFSIYVLWLTKILFGDSIFAIRFVPAFLSALTVFLTGLIVKNLGGGKYAILLASLAVTFAPIQLAMNTIYSMNSIDIFLWTIAFYLILLLIKEEKSKYWILIGLVIGIGLLNKISMVWFAFGFTAVILFSPMKTYLKTKSPYMAAFIAFIIFLPYILWNISYGFPHLEFISNAINYKYSSLTRWDFIAGQFLHQNPVSAIVWMAGIYFYFFNSEGRQYRVLGIIYAAAFLILLINGRSKAEYLSPAYTILFAGGAVMLERINFKSYFRVIKPGFAAVLILSGVMLAPLALPVLPVKTYIEYAAFLGVKPSTSEAKQLAELPQFYADMFGWENMALAVSNVYQTLSDEEKKHTVVIGQNYGESGAIDFYRKYYPLPEAVSTHNNYWLWKWKTESVTTVIVIGGRKEDHLRSCEEVIEAGSISCEYCMPYENNLKIYICRGIKLPLEEIWENEKNFN